MSSPTHPHAGVLVRSSAVAERYRASIYRYILRLVHDEAAAEDLTQETFLRVHQRLAELQDPAALQAWLYRIATNLCYDRFRTHEVRRPALPLAAVGDVADAVDEEDVALRPDQLLEQHEMSDCVLHFLTTLPDAQREVLVLHDLQGFTGPEIAKRLGLSRDNAKIRLHRARARLKTALAAGCDISCDERGVVVCERRRGFGRRP